MARIDVNYSGSGCGSGTSWTWIVKKDGVQVGNGSFQLPCDYPDLNAAVKGRALSLAAVYISPGDKVFVNGVAQGSGGWGTGAYVGLGLLVAAAYMIFRR